MRMICAFLLGLMASPTMSQAVYPDRAIKVIVPVPAGSAADLLTRIFSNGLQDKWKQSVVIDNRVGASHNIGADAFARSAPDGYTLFSAPPPSFAINQYLFPKLSYDPTQFIPLTVMAEVPNVLVVRRGLGVHSLGELIKLAKSRPGSLNYGSTGKGSTLELSAEALGARAGIDLLEVPYSGVPQVVTELLAGRVDLAFVSLVDVYSHIAAGSLVPLGVAVDRRLTDLSDIPTISETFPGFHATAWFAVAVPSRTDPEIVRKLADAIRETFADPEAMSLMQRLRAIPVLNSPSDAKAFIDADSLRWKRIIDENHIRPD